MAHDRLIHFVCTAPAHRGTPRLGLTRHDGQWALCPELIADGHEWMDVGGLDAGAAATRWRLAIGLDPIDDAAA